MTSALITAPVGGDPAAAPERLADRLAGGPPVTIGSGGLRDLIAHIDAGVLDRDREDRPPVAEFELIRAARLGALRLPVEQGGGGATVAELFATVVDIAAADPDVAHSLRNHFQINERLIRRPHATNERWFDRTRAGDLFGLASSELSTLRAGVRDATYESTIVATADGLRLNGVKYYSTGNLYVQWLLAGALGPEDTPVQLVVSATAPGVLVDDDWDGIGQRFTGSGTTRFVDVAVSRDDYLEGSLYGDLPYGATFPQLYLTAIIAGILRRATREAAALVRGKERSFYHGVTERPADDPIVQESVGYLAAAASVAESAVLAAADALGAATDAHGTDAEYGLALQASLQSAKAKIVVDELGLRATSSLYDVAGGSAVRRVAQLDRHWRNIRTLASHNPRTHKARWVGNHEINGEPLPTGAFF
ncbi:MAG: acyl-CoA dehydrogenase family protein [Ilumatobacteraceae bacterium]